ncbi:SGNH/GDSL hydrolase family protein [Dickeya lacustris]|uniref:DUF459 domain-containing protein n=1 Tax=Dickeya lacustris TaxID=2259638 RepID=A0ABY8G375_9GAMM|nr:SGNH/GDSL hydrolase family protein [Dickeya lacustris]WFN54399.1 DUF459 domain-containing protein [Dickeya lacustris]
MPISEYRATLSHVLKSFLVMLSAIIGLIWLNQHSINGYWELHFHEKSPWESNTHPSWVLGDRVMKAAQAAKEAFVANWSGEESASGGDEPESAEAQASVSSSSSADAGPELGSHPDVPALSAPSASVVLSPPSPLVLPPSPNGLSGVPVVPLTTPVALKPSQAVMFMGDSMMEGVAPHVIKMLRDRYHLAGIDLSKRSTGLAYPGFFNWPLTLERELKRRQNVGLLVVFLGPNDPWDMPAGKGKPFLKFASQEWEEAYRERIRTIIRLAREKQIPVIWVSPPNMENKKLNYGMHYLDGLYQAEVTAANQILIQVNEIFGYRDTNYSAEIKQEKQKIRVRSGDGVHFSPAGQKMIADRIFDKIAISPSENEVSH